MKSKKLKLILLIFIILFALIVLFIYNTHKSVEQELSEEDLELRELLKNQNIQSNEPKIIEMDLESKSNEETENETIENNDTVISQTESQSELVLIKSGNFDPNATGSDTFHRGWGSVKLVKFEGKHKIIFGEDFRVINGPDYKLYLLKEQNIQTEDEFNKNKADAYRIADIKQFKGFQTFEVPQDINPDEIESVVIWCESFSQFISSANLY